MLQARRSRRYVGAGRRLHASGIVKLRHVETKTRVRVWWQRSTGPECHGDHVLQHGGSAVISKLFWTAISPCWHAYAGAQRRQGDGTMMPEEAMTWAMPE